jgi:hypothetical protein
MRAEDGRYPGADHSITRSGGRALEIETTALAVLALLDAAPDQPDRVRPSIAWLDRQRSGFGAYGSTQSTVLTLKALARYAELAGATRAAGAVTLYVNGEPVRELDFAAGHTGALELGDLSAALRPGRNQIELRLRSRSADGRADPLPYSVAITYRTRTPATSPHARVAVTTRLLPPPSAGGPAPVAGGPVRVRWGEGIALRVELVNLTDQGLPMALARVGLPAGLTFQDWQLGELVDRGLVDFYQTRDREVVLYLRQMAPGAARAVDLALLAAVPGRYVAPASSAYLYYTDEHKQWAEPVRVEVVRE